MAKKLYVGNLSYDTKDEALKELFASAGTVETATIIMDKFSGRSKGFGFVEMSTEEEAQNAISTLDGKELDGRNIAVSEARPMKERPAGGFRGNGGSRGGRDFGGRGRDNW